MRALLTTTLLCLLLLGSGGMIVSAGHGGDASSGSPLISQFSLLALIEAHEPGGDLSVEHHQICTDCTGFLVLASLAAVAFAVYAAAIRLETRTAYQPVFAPLAFSPLAPPPR